MLLHHAQRHHRNGLALAIEVPYQGLPTLPLHASAAAAAEWRSKWADAGSASTHQHAAGTDESPAPGPAAVGTGVGTAPAQIGTADSPAWHSVTAGSVLLWASNHVPAAAAAADAAAAVFAAGLAMKCDL